jgi:hypothetical protein
MSRKCGRGWPPACQVVRFFPRCRSSRAPKRVSPRSRSMRMGQQRGLPRGGRRSQAVSVGDRDPRQADDVRAATGPQDPHPHLTGHHGDTRSRGPLRPTPPPAPAAASPAHPKEAELVIPTDRARERQASAVHLCRHRNALEHRNGQPPRRRPRTAPHRSNRTPREPGGAGLRAARPTTAPACPWRGGQSMPAPRPGWAARARRSDGRGSPRNRPRPAPGVRRSARRGRDSKLGA